MLHFPRLALCLSLLALVACGSHGRKQHDDTNKQNPNGHKPQSTPDDDDSDDPSGSNDPAIPKPVQFTETLSRAVPMHYYQWDPRVNDLFSASGSSQLCWPAALANEMEFLRHDRQPPVTSLPEISHGADKESDEIRYFSNLCHTDKETGTTVIQGVNCIDRHLTQAGLTGSIAVTGVDAMWGTMGFFPEGVVSQRGSVVLDDIRADLKDGHGLILMLGYYRETANGWERVVGHFVSVTGYMYHRDWGKDRLKLRVMNPAIDPATSEPLTVDMAYEAVDLERPDVVTKLPDDIAFEIIGDNFQSGELRAFVESMIAFDAR